MAEDDFMLTEYHDDLKIALEEFERLAPDYPTVEIAIRYMHFGPGEGYQTCATVTGSPPGGGFGEIGRAVVGGTNPAEAVRKAAADMVSKWQADKRPSDV